MLKKLIIAGMSIARVNCSHGTIESNQATIKTVQTVRAKTKADVLVMLDTKGPDVRVGHFENGSAEVVDGQTFVFHTNEVVGNEKGVFVNYKLLPQAVKKGQRLLLDDGMVVMTVTGVTETTVIARVDFGGRLKNRKSLAAPGCDLYMPFISREDELDLQMGCKVGVDIIAASFVSRAQDVLSLKTVLAKYGKGDIPIISKIECAGGIQNIDDIIKVSDGIMVARGDLSVNMPIEQIPQLQKMIIQKSRAAGKPVITATEMLESMIQNPRPTLAETTDIANAVWDGTDYVMLSAETSVGKYPVRSVEFMRTIAAEAEKTPQYFRVK